MFISATDKLVVAEYFAATGKVLGPTSTYLLSVPANRAIKNLMNYDGGFPITNPWTGENLDGEYEWLIPVHIPNNWIESETPYTGPSL